MFTLTIQRRSYAFDAEFSAANLADWMNEFGLEDGLGGAKDKADKDAIWVNELTDDLTVAIALREWDRAVSLVEKGTFNCIHSLIVTQKCLQVKRKSQQHPL